MFSPKVSFQTQAVLQVKGSNDPDYSLNVMFDYMDMLYVGATDYSWEKISVNMGFKQSISQTYFLSFFVSYTLFYSNTPLSDNTLELFFTFSK